MLLRAKVRKINSKSLEVGAAEEHRLLRVGVQASPRGLVRLNVHRAAARTPLIAACLHDWPVQAAIPGKGVKRLFFIDRAGAWVRLNFSERSAAREFLRIRTRLLHVCKLSPRKRCSLGEESAMA